MRITPDTNVLVRLVTGDDAAQHDAAERVMQGSELVAVGTIVLCELAWVLARRYAIPRSDVARTIRALIETERVVVDRPAVEAGLAVLDAGGDFADGVIAHEGRWLGGEVFATFDQKAAKVLSGAGHTVEGLA